MVLVAVFNVVLCTFLITNEMEADMFPHHVQDRVFSNAYFKGTCYLVVGYFTICGGNTYSIAAAVITGLFAVITLAMAPRIQRDTDFRKEVGDQYLPEISISDSQSEADIDALITEYEPPLAVPGLADLNQPVTDFNAPIDSGDVDQESDITPPPQPPHRKESGSFKGVDSVQETR